MVRKKTEGDEQERRNRARDARREGSAPSEVAATTGSSKQLRHLQGQDDREERRQIHGGKVGGKGSPAQRPHRVTPSGPK
jgi:hypothetical protein